MSGCPRKSASTYTTLLASPRRSGSSPVATTTSPSTTPKPTPASSTGSPTAQAANLVQVTPADNTGTPRRKGAKAPSSLLLNRQARRAISVYLRPRLLGDQTNNRNLG